MIHELVLRGVISCDCGNIIEFEKDIEQYEEVSVQCEDCNAIHQIQITVEDI